MNSTVTVVDYNTSNIQSVGNMLRKIGIKARITSDPNEVRKTDKLILPGVGSFDVARQNLDLAQMPEALEEAVIKKSMMHSLNTGCCGNLRGNGICPYHSHFYHL